MRAKLLANEANAYGQHWCTLYSCRSMSISMLFPYIQWQLKQYRITPNVTIRISDIVKCVRGLEVNSETPLARFFGRRLVSQQHINGLRQHYRRWRELDDRRVVRSLPALVARLRHGFHRRLVPSGRRGNAVLRLLVAIRCSAVSRVVPRALHPCVQLVHDRVVLLHSYRVTKIYLVTPYKMAINNLLWMSQDVKFV